jgi:DNA-binding MarR family transcriptional regulator
MSGVCVMIPGLKPSQALRLWRDIHLSQVRDDETDLSVRQTAILLIIYLDLPPHTVRGLAQKLGVTKPVITRALNTMGKTGLVDRRRDEADRRNVIIQRTVKGALAVERLGDLILRQTQEHFS